MSSETSKYLKFGGAVTVGPLLARPVFSSIKAIRAPGTLTVIALAFAFVLSSLAATIGSAMILGAFAAGREPTGPFIGQERNSDRVRSGCVPPVVKDRASGRVSQDQRWRIQTTLTNLVHN